MEPSVVFEKDISFTDMGGGVKRRILAYNENMMIVEVHFEVGSAGTPHTHPHTQCTYVQSGRFCFTIDGRETEVKTGDSIAFPPNIVHGTLCLEAGVLLDIFCPMREDFL